MVNVSLPEKAIIDSKEWLAIAEKSLKMKVFSKAIYAMEMSVALALKALLLSEGIEYPKSHNLLVRIHKLVRSEKFAKREIKLNFDLILDTYHSLLDLRMSAAYSFESSYDSSFFEERALKYIKPVKRIIGIISKDL